MAFVGSRIYKGPLKCDTAPTIRYHFIERKGFSFRNNYLSFDGVPYLSVAQFSAVPRIGSGVIRSAHQILALEEYLVGFRIEHVDRWQRLMLVVEQRPLRNGASGHRLPPEDASNLASRSPSHYAVQFRQEIALPFRQFAETAPVCL